MSTFDSHLAFQPKPILYKEFGRGSWFVRPHTVGVDDVCQPKLFRYAIAHDGTRKLREAVMPDGTLVPAAKDYWPVNDWHPEGWVLNLGTWWSPVADPGRFPDPTDEEDFKLWGARIKSHYARVLPDLDRVTADEWKAAWTIKEAERKVRKDRAAAEVETMKAKSASRVERQRQAIMARYGVR